MTIPSTLRQFWAGVCALQDVTKLTDAINGWTTQREEIVRGSFLRLLKDLGYEHAAMLRWLNDQAIESDYLPPKWHARVDNLEHQLAAEREAHALALATECAAVTDRDKIIESMGAQFEAERQVHAETKRSLEQARDDLIIEREAHQETYTQLSATRADLEALTALRKWLDLTSAQLEWRKRQTEYSADCGALFRATTGAIEEHVRECRYFLEHPERITNAAGNYAQVYGIDFESLAAWKARKGEGDG